MDETLYGVVLVQPLGKTFELTCGQTLIQAAWQRGYYWPTICGGTSDCAACRCEVLEGDENILSETPRETMRLQRARAIEPFKSLRLACCLKVSGPATVFKQGVRLK